MIAIFGSEVAVWYTVATDNKMAESDDYVTLTGTRENKTKINSSPGSYHLTRNRSSCHAEHANSPPMSRRHSNVPTLIKQS